MIAPDHLTEKERIERASVEAFLSLFNKERGTSFAIFKMGDAPDARCVDPTGTVLNVEVTMTEDDEGDIAASLGRGEGGSQGARLGHQFNADVLPVMIERLKRKITKRYGPSTALLIRDSSGVDWDWDSKAVQSAVATVLSNTDNPFDLGIWLLTRAKDRLFRLA